MIIWTGWGFLTLVIGFGCAIIGEWLLDPGLGVGLGWIAGGLVNYLFLTLLRHSRPDWTRIAPENDETVVLRRRDRLLFIDTKWWSVIFVVIGIWNLWR